MKNVTINFSAETNNWIVCATWAAPKICSTWGEVVAHLQTL